MTMKCPECDFLYQQGAVVPNHPIDGENGNDLCKGTEQFGHPGLPADMDAEQFVAWFAQDRAATIGNIKKVIEAHLLTPPDLFDVNPVSRSRAQVVENVNSMVRTWDIKRAEIEGIGAKADIAHLGETKYIVQRNPSRVRAVGLLARDKSGNVGVIVDPDGELELVCTSDLFDAKVEALAAHRRYLADRIRDATEEFNNFLITQGRDA